MRATTEGRDASFQASGFFFLVLALSVSTVTRADTVDVDSIELTSNYDVADVVVTDAVVADPAAEPNSPSDEVLEAPGQLSAGQPAPVEAGCPRCGQACCPSACNSCCGCFRCRNLLTPVPPPCRLFPQQRRGVNFYGWVDAGGPFNFANPGNHFNGPFNAQARDQAQLNQLYLVAERALDTSDGLDFGGRFDLLYGNDFFYAQSVGLETHENGSARWNAGYGGLALPQMYGSAGVGNLSAKVGHFYTVIGYEAVTSPSNFFYTHSYSYQYAGPFTHWGALATYKFNDRITFDQGIVNGWNTLVRPTNTAAYIGRGTFYSLDLRKKLVGSLITGDEFAVTGAYANRTRYDLYLDLMLTQRLEYVIQYYSAWQQQGVVGGGTAAWYGIAQYAYYNLNSRWRAGIRGEWFRDVNGTRVSGVAYPANPNRGSFPGNFYEISAGLNWTVSPNLRIRPEVRFDWFDGTGTPFNGKSNQQLAAIDAILQF